MQETWGQEDPLEEGMATQSSILAWRIPWTEEPGRAIVHRVTKSWTCLKWLITARHSISRRAGRGHCASKSSTCTPHYFNPSQLLPMQSLTKHLWEDGWLRACSRTRNPALCPVMGWMALLLRFRGGGLWSPFLIQGMANTQSWIKEKESRRKFNGRINVTLLHRMSYLENSLTPITFYILKTVTQKNKW